ncbi:MAG: LPXTG cell wall anchor domain-containing protein [Atopobiaceae bacterium]|nr:LPXTG cell wall anchor domain-containing protein [Atopobiaceae bacterium]
MADRTQRTSICRAGVSLSLAAALAMGATATMARPAFGIDQVDAAVEEPSSPQAEEQVVEVDQDSQAILPASESGSSYDPRTTEGTSAVRDQFWGTCWAQSGISSTESYLIHTGKESTGIQLSVEDMLWWTHQSAWKLFFREESGFPAMATGYLSTVGVRSEADIPYLGKPDDLNDDDMRNMSSSNTYGEGQNLRPANYDTAPVLYEITDIVFVKEPSRQEVKDLITKYGAVNAVYKASDEYFDNTHSTDWGNGRYGESGEEMYESNHAVSVVGWDDSFPKEYFAEQNGKKPEHDGAWILKNSFGTSYGSDDGFTYVSYDDEFLFKNDSHGMGYCYSIAGARKPVAQKRYMHDKYGAVTSWQPASDGSCTWANVFDFGSGERMAELSFVSWTKGGTYALYYAPVSDGTPSADESAWIPLASGTIDHAGYTTVPATWNAEVPAGKGAIVLKVSGDVPNVGIENNLTNVRGTPLFTVEEQNARGKGYILKDGGFSEATIATEIWGQMETLYPILSIRAYTVAYEAPADDGSKDDGRQPSEDVTPAPANDKQEQATGGSTKKSTKSASTKAAAKTTPAKSLPKTGDESHASAAALALAGSALVAVGATRKRLRELMEGRSR